MNNRGFTLVELLATLVILSIVIGITIAGVNGAFGSAKNKSEDVFVETIEDAMEMYLDSGATDKNGNALTFQLLGNECSLTKTHGTVKMYKATTTFAAVINSKYKPITQKDLVNPANEDVNCEDASNIDINIYRDEDFVYYYSIDKDDFECFTKTGTIDNLPEGYGC